MAENFNIIRISKNPIFIGGSGRCGTSIVAHMLASHPDVLYFAEPGFLTDLGGVFDLVHGRITAYQFFNMMMGPFRKSIVDSLHISGVNNADGLYSADIIKSMFLKSFVPSRNLLEAVTILIDNIFCHGMIACNKLRWVEKSPYTICAAHVLHNIFPDMKYVHIIREPKDVCYSVIVQSWGPNSVEEFINDYNYVMRNALLSLKAIPRDQLLTIKFEKLVKKPIENLKTLLDFTDLPYSSQEFYSWTSMVKPDNANIGRCQKELSAIDTKKIDKHCRELYFGLCDLSTSK